VRVRLQPALRQERQPIGVEAQRLGPPGSRRLSLHVDGGEIGEEINVALDERALAKRNQ
jgi:hypothetical protein